MPTTETTEHVTLDVDEFKKLDRQCKHLKRIKSLSQKCDKLKAAWETKKEEAGAAKKQYDEQVGKLRSTISTGPEQLMLSAVESMDEDPPAEEQAEEAAQAVEGTAWREVKLETLDIPDGSLQCLYAAELETLGDLCDWQRRTEKELGAIKGIGPAKAKKIEEAMDRFWADNPNCTSE